MADDLAEAIRGTAQRLGVDPYDLGTVVSYETGGRMSPSIRGGSGGRHLGLIQFDQENQKKYGVTDQQTAAEQMQAVESYLRDRGVKPGHGLLDLYSTVNAGRPGLYNRSDAANGGLPGSVRDKVLTMGPHRVRAQILLDGKMPPSFTSPRSATLASPAIAAPAAETAPLGLAPPSVSAAPVGGEGDAIIAAAQKLAAMAQEPDKPQRSASIDLTWPLAEHIARSKALARIARNPGAAR